MKLNPVVCRVLGIASFSAAILGLVLAQMPNQVGAQQVRHSLRRGKIVGGTPASANAYPWVVALEDSTGFQFCAGTLIAVNKVLTAAHCTKAYPTGELRVRIGSDQRIARNGKGLGGTLLKVQEQRRHPRYRDLAGSYDYDAAIWTLTSSVTLSNSVSLISLPSACGQVGAVVLNCASGLVAPGTLLRVIGWGTTTSGGSPSSQLLQVDVPVVSNTLCNRAVSYGGAIKTRMFCAGEAVGGKDSCQGDSGGPIFGNYSPSTKTALQAGIVSWGEGCALPNKYGVYARISNPEIRTFITKQGGV